jgi:hypothetical protein
LERVSPELVLGVPGGPGAGASLSIIASQQVKQVCALQFHGGIGFALLINEQREGDARFLAKGASIDSIAKSNGCQGRTAVAEGLFVGAQLRDVLAAENSAVMAQESNHRWLAHPQRTKAKFLTVYVRQGDHGKTTIECAVHAFHSEWLVRRVKLSAVT